jgi:hypothetical protein
MPLQRGEILGYDFNRMVVDFTMLNQSKTVRCAIRPKGRSLSSNSSSGKCMGWERAMVDIFSSLPEPESFRRRIARRSCRAFLQQHQDALRPRTSRNHFAERKI